MRFVRAYLPVLLWMMVIYVASTELGSIRRTSQVIGPVLRFFSPDISDETIRQVQLVLRKGAHLAEYGVLAALAWRARRVISGNLREFHWPEAWIIVPFCSLYAVTDELHQSFISSRQGSVLDVFIDTLGAFLGLVIVWAVGHRRKLW